MSLSANRDGEHSLRLLARFHDHMSLYGYEVLDLPIIESADLFLIKAGDQIIQKLFTFDRHGRQMALRPEFTAAAAYWYGQHFGAAEFPVARWQFSGSIFEDDPNNSVQSCQRLSVGAELIGMSGAVADAEIISLAVSGLLMQGLTDIQISLGHAGLIWQVLDRFGLDSRTQRFLLHNLWALKDSTKGKTYIVDQIDRFLLGRASLVEESAANSIATTSEVDTQVMLDVLLDATQRSSMLGGRTRYDIARRLLQKQKRVAERSQIVSALDLLEQWSHVNAEPRVAFAIMEQLIHPQDVDAMRSLREWQEVIDLLDAHGIETRRIRIQADLVRNWDYYTGIVFELKTKDGVQIGGGGRYDELIRLIGGQRSVPAVGFAYDMEKLLPVLPLTADSASFILTITFQPQTATAAVRWATELRKRGWGVRLLPVSDARPAGDQLRIEPDGSALLGSRIYPFSELEMLVSDLTEQT